MSNQDPELMAESGWTIDTLFAYFHAVIEEKERRYQERFEAQEKAVRLALENVNKEFHEHLVTAREEMKAALVASDKAITKSEVATERRFESMNDFRGQLADQVARFITREEADRSVAAVSRRLDDLSTTFSDKLEAATKAMEAKVATIDAKVSGVEAVVR